MNMCVQIVQDVNAVVIKCGIIYVVAGYNNIYLSRNMVSYVLLKRLNINLKIYIYLIMEINKEIIKILDKIITNKYNYIT